MQERLISLRVMWRQIDDDSVRVRKSEQNFVQLVNLFKEITFKKQAVN